MRSPSSARANVRLAMSGSKSTASSSVPCSSPEPCAGWPDFTAVMVSWLAKFNPIWMILTSFLLVFLGRGAGEIATKFGLNQSFGDILTGVILFCIIGSEFFINYQIKLTRRGKEP